MSSLRGQPVYGLELKQAPRNTLKLSLDFVCSFYKEDSRQDLLHAQHVILVNEGSMNVHIVSGFTHLSGLPLEAMRSDAIVDDIFMFVCIKVRQSGIPLIWTLLPN